MDGSSDISGFHKLSMKEKLDLIGKMTGLSEEEMKTLANTGGLPADVADRMIENVIGGLTMPLGVATNFKVNGKDYLVPMALEEPSVVAGASKAAKIARAKGGFTVTNTGPLMIGQVQVINVPNPEKAKTSLLERKTDILKRANDQDPVLVSLGGGAKDLNVKVLSSIKGPMVVAELIVNTGDAMGANAVNTMSEAVAPMIEEVIGGKALLRIISNLADRRLVRATAVFDKEGLGGEEIVDGIVNAYAFADADPYRCATHNKGIMNGVVAVGLVGGAARTHPAARAAIKILGVKTAIELAEVMGAVGLAQNVAALRALADEGIQRGHMKLHARNVAVNAGATGKMVDLVADRMIAEKKIRADRAKELVEEMSKAK